MFDTNQNNIKIFDRQTGFTLIELLVVMGIIGGLVAATLFAVNSGRLRANSRNSQRQIDITTIMNAVYQYALDNNSQLPAVITTTATAICKTGASSCTGLIDLSVLTASQKYLVSLPNDPTAATTTSTGYTISKNANNRVIITATAAENSATIILTR